jgi:hypothetical protein
MQTLLNHTLFPHAANWSTPPTRKRRWQTGVASALSNVEQRAALRALPLHTLTFTITAASLAERARLDARTDQALKSGYGCTPFHGMGTGLAVMANAGTNSLTLLDAVNPWAWAAGDYVILIGDDDTVFDVQPVTIVAGNVLTLAGNLTNNWHNQALVWPVLFGKFSAQKSTQFTNWNSHVPVSIQQLVAERNAQLGAVAPDTGTGVGHDTVGGDMVS